MSLSRADIDLLLSELDALICSAPEDGVPEAYFEGSQIFHDHDLPVADLAYVSARLWELIEKYGIHASAQ